MGSKRAGAVVTTPTHGKEVMILGGEYQREKISETYFYSLTTHKWRKGPHIPREALSENVSCQNEIFR